MELFSRNKEGNVKALGSVVPKNQRHNKVLKPITTGKWETEN